MWKLVDDQGMNVYTHVVLADSAEHAMERLNATRRKPKFTAEQFVEIKDGMWMGIEDRWPNA